MYYLFVRSISYLSLLKTTISSSNSINSLLINENNWLNQPDDIVKYFNLSSIYRQLSSGYAIKAIRENFDYRTSVKEYDRLSALYHKKYINEILSKRQPKLINS